MQENASMIAHVIRSQVAWILLNGLIAFIVANGKPLRPMPSGTLIILPSSATESLAQGALWLHAWSLGCDSWFFKRSINVSLWLLDF